MSDIVVVGGGVVGASTCYYAKQLGAQCRLVERDGVASHASGFAFGGLHPRVVASAESDMPQFASESYKEHQTLHEQLEATKANSSTWRRRASVSLAWNELESRLLKAQAAENPVEFQWIDANDLCELEPRVSRESHGGLLTRDTAEVDSSMLTRTLFQEATPDFIQDNVVAIEIVRDCVECVRTSRGEEIRGGAFVFTMGPWSSEAFKWFDINCRVTPLKGQVLRLKIEGRPFQQSFSTNGNYMSTKSDGLLWIGTTEENAGFDESTSEGGRREIVHVLQRILSDPQSFDVVKQTACLRPIAPDGELILGRVPGIRNAYVGTGGGRKGILYGPLMGKYLANLAIKTNGSERWTSLSLDRFASST